MQTINCFKGCCQLRYLPYDEQTDHLFTTVNRGNRKAGIFIVDDAGKILLVQSKGNFWGCPKGAMHSHETSMECAVREVKEETGLDIPLERLKSAPRYDNFRGKATYFYLEIPHQKVDVQSHILDNDANGIGWIFPNCLRELVFHNKITVNHHCRLAAEKFLRLNLWGFGFKDFIKKDCPDEKTTSSSEDESRWNSLSSSPNK